MTAASGRRSTIWKWTICGLLLLATMLNYMDRQTLSLTITEISAELGLNNEQYGNLETGFGFAFAGGAICFGLLVDRFSVRWLYPLVFAGWSLAGIAAAYAELVGGWLTPILSAMSPSMRASAEANPASMDAYLGLMACRVVLGFFEAGHWPCALVTTQNGCYRAPTARWETACCRAALRSAPYSHRWSCWGW